MSRFVTLAAWLAWAGTAHAAINARLMRAPREVCGARPRVSVLLPARDEAWQLGRCLDALLPQDFDELVLLDDCSSDRTGELGLAAARTDPRVRVVHGTEPPSGWLGKPHACAQLAALADPRSDVLVFLDADVRLEPGALRAAVGLLDDRMGVRLDLVSPYPRQVAVTPAERLVQPLLQWSWLTTLPLRLAERSARPALAAANGQFLVVRRRAYEQAGGHAAVRAAVLDDIALARRVVASGGRVAIADGSEWASCRMYRSWPELRDGYTKSLWAAFGSPPAAAAASVALGFVYVLPALALLRGSRAGLVGYGAGVAGRVITARATGGRVWPDVLEHPASIAAFGYLTARSVLQHRRGRLTWKGRPLS